ncbi:predicted protein [Nematostella vectensis]|uniref:Uncharacterized protein n=1 Tax=Nematostella vectensis TaxID=45351 RepID=A7RRZ5_NEMVE|nr:predicted protein [Nematostella vectensis]|eukprot:XP_001637776.1 predicted protein [Nematostella vectensis]
MAFYVMQLWLLVFPTFLNFALCSNKCKWNEYITKDIVGNEACVKCPNCAEGHGLMPECGSHISYGDKFRCVPCTDGETYSSSNDLTSCRPCSLCPHKKVIQKCNATQNSICDTRNCEEGFYYDDITRDCQPCSWCCGDGKDDIKMSCKVKGQSSYKLCTYDTGRRCLPRCTNKQYVVVDLKTLKKTCQECPTCQVGHGLSPPCSSVLTNPANHSCVKCAPGKSFSESIDSSSCKPCSKCAVGQMVERACNSTHDTLCGDCSPGFYRDFSVHPAVCGQCSYCCGDDIDVIEKECTAQGMPPKKQCSFTERSISVCSPKHTNNRFYATEPFKWYYAVIIAGVILVISLAFVAFYVKRDRRFGYKQMVQHSQNELCPTADYHCEPLQDHPSFVTGEGNVLWFPTAGVKLHLPHEFYGEGVDNEVYGKIKIGVHHDRPSLPTLNEHEVLLSPAIRIRPDGAELQEPITIEIPHTADLGTDNQWSLRVLTCYDTQAGPEWTDDLMSVKCGELSVSFNVTKLGVAYAVVGSPVNLRLAKKRMVCAVFAAQHIPGNEPVDVVCYLLDDCESSLKRVRENEHGQEMYGCLKKCHLHTDPNGEIRLQIANLTDGWKVQSIEPQRQSWLNSIVEIPKFNAVLLSENSSTRELHFVFQVYHEATNQVAAEVPVDLPIRMPFKSQPCTVNIKTPTSDEKTPPACIPLASLPPSTTRDICGAIPQELCPVIATKLKDDLSAEELHQIQYSNGHVSQLLRTMSQLKPELSVSEFRDALMATPGCEEPARMIEEFMKNSGGIESV